MSEHTLLGLGPAGFHRLAYTQWGSVQKQPVTVCAHGLTRNGRDFDALATVLAEERQVLCPDFPGRGKSDWLTNPADYDFPLYLADMVALIARSGAEQVDWIGTSMGGLIGLLLAARPRSPVRRLVVNDVGPFIPRAALERIASYVGQAPIFPDLDAVEAYLRRVNVSFGPLTDSDWRHFVVHGVRPWPEGGFALHYDPAIAHAQRARPMVDVDLWSAWDAVRCSVLVIRGADSDVLTTETLSEMRTRGPGCELIEVPGCGHVPALMAPALIGQIRDWLDA